MRVEDCGQAKLMIAMLQWGELGDKWQRFLE